MENCQHGPSKSKPTKYRATFLLSVISKVMDSLVLSGGSSSAMILSLINSGDLDHRTADIVTLDIKDAFDQVWHNSLFAKKHDPWIRTFHKWTDIWMVTFEFSKHWAMVQSRMNSSSCPDLSFETQLGATSLMPKTGLTARKPRSGAPWSTPTLPRWPPQKPCLGSETTSRTPLGRHDCQQQSGPQQRLYTRCALWAVQNISTYWCFHLTPRVKPPAGRHQVIPWKPPCSLTGCLDRSSYQIMCIPSRGDWTNISLACDWNPPTAKCHQRSFTPKSLQNSHVLLEFIYRSIMLTKKIFYSSSLGRTYRCFLLQLPFWVGRCCGWETLSKKPGGV